jgi:putative transposase
MDGRGRWMDNVFIERLWRSLKYECVYLSAFETGSELRAGLTWWIGYYNSRRPHSTLAGRSPDDAYWAPRDGQTGGLTTTRTELIQAAKLSNWRGPSQTDRRGRGPLRRGWSNSPSSPNSL